MSKTNPDLGMGTELGSTTGHSAPHLLGRALGGSTLDQNWAGADVLRAQKMCGGCAEAGPRDNGMIKIFQGQN